VVTIFHRYFFLAQYRRCLDSGGGDGCRGPDARLFQKVASFHEKPPSFDGFTVTAGNQNPVFQPYLEKTTPGSQVANWG
jgi:hypothetical protein